eukprot:CAMPEP_0197845342 /NCGR_PEP_ID=MMETSP1438-20131217/2286_1 /TAXON_ID=1461541 /ORGANISM="Pterosperma sp., Strain CCMP1384" /LENGTH=180 /DNA_ID=CAMNT_0043456601 /DNA_START=902 /DNA_END=1441 /DNA_ORIENTATION=+
MHSSIQNDGSLIGLTIEEVRIKLEDIRSRKVSCTSAVCRPGVLSAISEDSDTSTAGPVWQDYVDPEVHIVSWQQQRKRAKRLTTDLRVAVKIFDDALRNDEYQEDEEYPGQYLQTMEELVFHGRRLIASTYELPPELREERSLQIASVAILYFIGLCERNVSAALNFRDPVVSTSVRRKW